MVASGAICAAPFTLGIEDALNRHVALLASKLSAANRRKRAILDPPRATP